MLILQIYKELLMFIEIVISTLFLNCLWKLSLFLAGLVANKDFDEENYLSVYISY